MVWWTDGTRRVAYSLRKLYDQVDAFAPDRNKIDDGTIGNEAHQQTHSEHNPDDLGIVRALDITHDPAHGVDTYQLADMLRLSKDHRIRYVISNSRIAGGEEYAEANHATAWEWGHYGGANPHDHHMHVSVVGDAARYDLTEDWAVHKTEGGAGPSPSSEDRPKKGATGTAVEEVQRLLGLEVDSIFGAGTDAAVRAFQSQHGLLSDGIVGPQTWDALRSGKPPPALTDRFPYSSKGSWYSQLDGKYHWHDGGDEPGSAALTGTPDNAQGISFYDHSTLGHWFEVLFPNGHTSIEQQTDIGPNPNTGRKIDISAAAAERAGYSPDDLHLPNAYPTDAIVKWRPIDVPAEVAGLSPVQQAIRYRDLRGLTKPPVVDPPVVIKPVLTVADLIAQIDTIADDLRKKADTLNSIRKALTEKTMADTTQPQIDWGAILQPLVKAVLPELMKVLPQILPQLLPLILPLLVNLLTGRKAVAAVQTSAPTSMPPGLVTGGLGLVGAILTSVLHSRGWLPADVADPATLIGLTAAGIGGGQAAKATLTK